MVMSSVRIAELKSRLSEHLRTVRRGRSITVLDRDTPVARIVPYESDGASLCVRLPKPGSPTPGQVPLPPPLRLGHDILDLLLEERQGER
jgi:prevent-host-death family protein